MKIKMKGAWQSPDRSARAGQVIDVPEKQAVKLVGNGSAEYAGPVEKPEKKKLAVDENTSAKPAENTAVRATTKKARRK